ncbi:MAG: glycosyltransferase [Ruminiclostridium sp.]|nr:glycosyltransferase [Ruminiclostridium sp.]
MSISVVLLAYKEAENLKVLLPQIKEKIEATGENYEMIIVDTAQPLDNTSEVCEQFGARYVNQRYPGFGGAFRTGIEEAQFDKFLIMDSDGSHNPVYITDIYNRFCQGADLVIGSRYVKGGKTNDAFSSIVMSKILNTVFRIVIGVKAKDISTDFRMYDTAQLKKTELTCQNYDVLQEVLMRLKQNNKKLVIAEVPISFDKRMFGESKRRLIPFIIGYIKTMFRLIAIRISSCFTKRK